MPPLEPIDPNLFVELIQEPERIFERSLEFQLSVAQDPHTPPEILAILVRGDLTVAEAAAMHVNLAGELTSDWQIEIDKYLEEAELGQNDRLAVELLKIGSFPPELMSRWIPPDKLIAALKNPDVSQRDRSKLLARLAEEFTVESRLIAAKSSETPQTVLKKLSEDLDSAVRLAAKDNPNYPPELLKSIDKRERGYPYPNPESDPAIDLAMRKEIAQNPLTSTATLDTLSLDLASDVRYLVAGNSGTSMQTLEKLSQDRNEWVKWGILKNPKLNNALLRQIITNSSDTLKIAALCQLQAPIDRVLAEIINRPETLEIILRECFYNNKTLDLPVHLLAVLAKNREEKVRVKVASHPNTPKSILIVFTFDPEPSVRTEVALNPQTPLELLMEMENRERGKGYMGCHITVCASIVKRHDTTTEALELVVKQGYSWISKAAAAHPNLSVQGLEWIILNEKNRDVLSTALHHPHMTAEMFGKVINHPQQYVRELLAQEQNCPSEILEELSLVEIFSNINSVAIYRLIAANPNASVATLERFICSKDIAIRIAVASNQSTPIPILERLGEDESARVRYAVAQNPRTPDSIRAKLQQRDLIPAFPHRFTSSFLKGLSRIYKANKDDIADILREYAASENDCVRFAALLHPKTPVEVLERAGRSLFWLERYAVAVNPTTPPKIRQLLAQDSNRIVRAVASSQ